MSRIEIMGGMAFILTFLVSIPLAYLFGPYVVLIWIAWPIVGLWFWGVLAGESKNNKKDK